MAEILFEKGSPGRVSMRFPRKGVANFDIENIIPSNLLRDYPPPLPELYELEVVRHFVNLSRKNFGVDNGFYPLGSCTMKYNPKINDQIASDPRFADLHPMEPESTVQGALRVMYELEQALIQITGMKAFSLQPAAGAQGELTSLLITKAFHKHNKESTRKIVLVPDSAHGTNPASGTMCGYTVVAIPTGKGGILETADVKTTISQYKGKIAALMITNPNTLGLFEKSIVEICRLIHKDGGLVYYDGANMNALLGLIRPVDMGFDILHLNLHKTFSTPHGGGGPGAGPIGVTAKLTEFLPNPYVAKEKQRFTFKEHPRSVGRVKSYWGNFLVLLRALVYIRTLGSQGLEVVAQNAIVNANYLQHRLKDHYLIPYLKFCMHEFVLSCSQQKKKGVRAYNIAKKLLEQGMHAPTVYFPLIVEEAMMIEPTETETQETLDRFADLMINFAKEIEIDPEGFKKLKGVLPVKYPDEALAARRPNLRWKPHSEE